jgi:hypothetical protein
MLPLRIISEANARDHWFKTAERKRQHRRTALLMLRASPRPDTDETITITLTRIAPRVLDDDNLASGFKAVRDGVADWLGINDGSPRLAWRYAQRKGATGIYAAEVQVEWAAA